MAGEVTLADCQQHLGGTFASGSEVVCMEWTDGNTYVVDNSGLDSPQYSGYRVSVSGSVITLTDNSSNHGPQIAPEQLAWQ